MLASPDIIAGITKHGMAAEVDVAAVVAMDEVDLVPLSALLPLSPSSVCSSMSSASCTSNPMSPIDSDALSAASSNSHEVDCGMDDRPAASSKQPQPSDDIPSLDEHMEPLLTHIGEGAMLHPLSQFCFGSRLSFSHFVHFINHPQLPQPSPIEQSSDGRLWQSQSQLSLDSSPLVLAAPSVASSSSSSTSASTAVFADSTSPCASSAAPSSLLTGSSPVTFTLECAAVIPPPVLTSFSIHDDYKQLQQQHKRLLRTKAAQPPAQSQSTTATTTTSTTAAPSTTPSTAASVPDPANRSSDTTPPEPAKKRRGRRRAVESTSASGSTSGSKGRKRCQAAVRPNLIIKFKRVRAEPEQQPTRSALSNPEDGDCHTASYSPPLPPSEVKHEPVVDAAAVGTRPVVEDREHRKARLEWERFLAHEARVKQEKERLQGMEWQVTREEQPAAATAASPTKAADTADDILSAAERHDQRLARIEAAPLLAPTAAEFSNPMRYIRHVVNKHRQYGVVCIRPPEGWRPSYEYSLDREGISFPCKRQVVKRYYGQGDSGEGRDGGQGGEEGGRGR